MYITRKLTLDLGSERSVRVIPVCHEDSYTRILEITFTNQSIPWPVPENVAVLIRYRKPDGTEGIYDTLPDGTAAWSISENTLTVVLAPQVCCVPGTVTMFLTLILGDRQLSSFPFCLQVANPLPLGEDSQDYTNLSVWMEQWMQNHSLTSDQIAAGVETYFLEHPIEMVETDPTVPAWAKQPSKPTYTASEVGALPNTTVIPTVPTNVSAFTNDAGYLTQHQDVSGKLDASALPTAIQTALTQAKESGEFDGTSATHSWNGTVLTVTSASGTSSTDLKGEKGDTGATGPQGTKGDKGDPGTAGYTPVKGTDYWTAADKSEIAAQAAALVNTSGKLDKNQGSANVGKILMVGTDGNLVLTDLPEAATGDVVGVLDESNNILLTGTGLADGTYSLKFENHNGAITEVGELVVTTIVPPSYSNLAEPNATNTTDWSIWCNNARIGSDGKYRSDVYSVVNYIPVAVGDVVRWEGLSGVESTNVAWYKSDKVTLCNAGVAKPSEYKGGVIADLSITATGGQFTIANHANLNGLAYVRFAGTPIGNINDVVITKNEPIT